MEILIAIEDGRTRAALDRSLKKYGYRTSLFESAHTFILARAGGFRVLANSVVILDASRPKTGESWLLAKALQALPLEPPVQIIFISSIENEETKALKTEGYDVLKPRGEEVYQLIHSAG